MPQIFPRSSNTLSRVGIISAVVGVPALFSLGFIFNMTYSAEIQDPKTQPVQFSHKHHVGDDGIDCRYCHTSVDKSDSAGMPSTYTCMSCHSQLWSDSPELEKVRESFRTGKPIQWARVHDLPDFVFFNHSIHVQKGVSCVSCHGRVDEMPLMYKENTLTMEWCLRCHRNPEKNLRPREYVYDLAWTLKQQPGEHGAGGEAGANGASGASNKHDTEPDGHNHEGHVAGATPGHDSPEYKDQTEMGSKLLREYKILSKEQMTSCSTCHR
jgi:hypothetical protein